ncbi:MAG: ABC transporter permease subunit [Clostridia bacterium]|nr:ABC transporter permease subunit [Clostridia bacterium]
MKLKNTVLKTSAVLLALCAWQTAVCYIDLPILLPSPLDVLKRLTTIWKDEGFLSTVLFTFGRIISGFFKGFGLGIVLALIAGRWKIAEHLFWPYLITVKSVPVASFIIIALLWISTEDLASFISFLMVLPIVYTNVLQGYESIDKKKKEAAEVFGLSYPKRLVYIYLPAIKPFIISACSVSFGLAWKSGVAAEFIGLPEGSVGEALYYSKIYFETVDLFTWTLLLVLLSVCFEKIMVAVIKLCFKGVEKL